MGDRHQTRDFGGSANQPESPPGRGDLAARSGLVKTRQLTTEYARSHSTASHATANADTYANAYADAHAYAHAHAVSLHADREK